jgi:hypothetical protein
LNFGLYDLLFEIFELHETSSGYGTIKVGATPLARHTQGV